MTTRSEEHTSELQSRPHLVCRLLLEKKKTHRLPSCRPPYPPRPRTLSPTRTRTSPRAFRFPRRSGPSSSAPLSRPPHAELHSAPSTLARKRATSWRAPGASQLSLAPLRPARLRHRPDIPLRLPAAGRRPDTLGR